MAVQSILFYKDNWTTKMARRWLKKKGFKPIKRVDIIKNFLRYRINPPEKFKRIRIKKIPKSSIVFVFGFK